MATRVVQWATGAVGSTTLKAIIEHPDLELVGVWVHTPEKVGKDAGPGALIVCIFTTGAWPPLDVCRSTQL